MNILVTGSQGLVGSHFVEWFKKPESDPINHADIRLLTPSITELDISDKKAVMSFFDNNTIDVTIHFAAFTDVSKAEDEREDDTELSWRVNVIGTKNLVEAAKHGHFINISTDMVFSGRSDDKGPYDETHPPETIPDHVPWYGWTKAEGERIVSQLNKYAIVRISNPVRKDYSLKLDYVHKIIKSYQEKGKVTLFNNQYLTLTHIPSVTESLTKIIEKKLIGVFHFSSPDLFTPYELGRYVLGKKYNAADAVVASSLADFKQKTSQNSRYPQYGGLKCLKTQQKLGIIFPAWREVVDMIV